MNYYESFKPQAETRCKSLFKTVSDLKTQLPKVKKRLADEKQNQQNLQGRLAKLKELSVESLAGDALSYEKFKVSMKKLQNELAVSEEIIDNVTRNILPNAEGRLKDAQKNLLITLNALCAESKKIANTAINDLLRACLVEYDAFLAAFTKLFQDYGINFICSDENYCPSSWCAREIDEMRLSLGMTEAVEPSREQIWANYRKESETPESEAVTSTTSDEAEAGGL